MVLMVDIKHCVSMDRLRNKCWSIGGKKKIYRGTVPAGKRPPQTVVQGDVAVRGPQCFDE